MKVCGGCGDHYDQRVDFCFRDGEILVSLNPTGLTPSPTSRATPEVLPVVFVRARRGSSFHPTEPPSDPSTVRMAVAALAFMALLVPVLGGLLTWSMVTGEPEAAAEAP